MNITNLHSFTYTLKCHATNIKTIIYYWSLKHFRTRGSLVLTLFRAYIPTNIYVGQSHLPVYRGTFPEHSSTMNLRQVYCTGFYKLHC